MPFAHLSVEERKALSQKGLDAHWKAAREAYPPCLRCGHWATAHTHKRCRNCECECWVTRVCQDCGEYALPSFCKSCWKNRDAASTALRLRTWVVGPYCRIPNPTYSTAEYKRLVKERKQREWLREGKTTLKSLRKYLRNHEASPSPQPVSPLAKILPGS